MNYEVSYCEEEFKEGDEPPRRDRLKITIKDTGKGIENIDNIGNWFHSLDIVNRVNQVGIGFGLNISKRLIAKLGGELKI